MTVSYPFDQKGEGFCKPHTTAFWYVGAHDCLHHEKAVLQEMEYQLQFCMEPGDEVLSSAR